MNILNAIITFAKHKNIILETHYKNSNRIMVVGDILEYFVKDLFADTLNVKDIIKKEQQYQKYFSYLGGINNPPDLILKNGDAIEVKKIEHLGGSIALNSSYPKNKLRIDDSFINNACKNCENWKEKDIIYAIGSVKKKELLYLWFVYGDCYCADKEIYERIKTTITKGIDEIENVSFSQTKELGRVNKVDPLGVTYLRIRGMWGILHPESVFGYLCENHRENILNCIILEEKYQSFSQEDRASLEQDDKIGIKHMKIKNPNNPAKLMNALHIFIKK